MHLLWRQLEYPAWNQSFEPYWQSLPKWGTIYSKENWLIEPEHTALFQEPYLVRGCLELQDPSLCRCRLKNMKDAVYMLHTAMRSMQALRGVESPLYIGLKQATCSA